MEGKYKNFQVIKNFIKEINIPIQLGGGIRDLSTIKSLIDVGVDRVILGTKAVQEKEMLKKAVDTYKEKIVVAIDAKGGYVAVNGWTKTSTVNALQFAKEIEQLGVETIIYTDIARMGC